VSIELSPVFGAENWLNVYDIWNLTANDDISRNYPFRDIIEYLILNKAEIVEILSKDKYQETTKLVKKMNMDRFNKRFGPKT
jgi:hypothetical protein